MAYDNPEEHYEEAVRYIILLLIFVFDPLAVLLLIAANHIQMSSRPTPEDDPDPEYVPSDNDDTSNVTQAPTRDEFWETDLEDLPKLADEKEYATLSEAFESKFEGDLDSRFRELLANQHEDETIFVSGAPDEDLSESAHEILAADETLAELIEPSEDEAHEVDTELSSRGYTTFAELSIEHDDVLRDVIANLNSKERVRALTPTENKWRNSCLNILDRRRNNNPLYDVKKTDLR
jgi:hypothetical protein